METIKNYLDSMFSGLMRTPKTERAKLELFNMMEDKYNELIAEGKSENEAIGRVISEFGNLSELKEELGLYESDAISDTRRTVSPEEAGEYLSATVKCANKTALGVSLCIFSPALLIVLAGSSVLGYTESMSKLAAFVGLMLLFAIIAVAVALFITTRLSMSRYDYLKNEVLFLERSTLAYLRELSEKFKQSYALSITVGVVLCVMSVVPLLGIALLISEEETAVIFGVAIMLVLLSVGVFLIIKAGMTKGSYNVLLQEGEYSNKKANRQVDKIAQIYWSVAVAIYLIWSFTTFNWGITWIIWPIAGVLFGVVSAIVNATYKEEK